MIKLMMNFEHIATTIPHNVPMTFIESILYRIGFENRMIDQVMEKWDIREEDYFFEGVTNAR